MKSAKSIVRFFVVSGTILMMASPLMAAGQQKGSGAGKGTMDRTRTPGQCKGVERDVNLLIFHGIAAGYGDGGGAGKGTKDRTRTPGQCKGIESSNNEQVV